jgi:hypothetical protein
VHRLPRGAGEGEGMTRAEHLAWAKTRALNYVDDPEQAVASMGSDLGKHDELSGHPGIQLGFMELLAGTMRGREAVRRWIEGFQ